MRRTQPDIGASLRRAVALHQGGQLAEAEGAYRAVLQARKNHPDATHLLAMVLHQRGDTAGGLSLLDRLLRQHPGFGAAHNSRGLMLHALERHDEAIASFARATAIDADYAAAWMNRGHALLALGREDEAGASYDRAIKAQPGYMEAHYAKGLLLQRQGAAAEALACYDRALAIRADSAETLNNRGVVLERLGRMEEALSDYARAVGVAPGFAEAWNNQGAALDRLGRYGEAVASFRRAVANRPGFGGALRNLADALYVGGRRGEALAAVGRCLAADPGDMRARVQRMMFQLPVLYGSEAEIFERRRAYEGELRGFCTMAEAERSPGRLAEAVEISQPFFLAYQGLPDLDLQRMRGEMVGRVMADRGPGGQNGGTTDGVGGDACDTPAFGLGVVGYPRATHPMGEGGVWSEGGRVRVGIVCGFFRQHPVWRIPVQGWVTQLDRERFEVIGYHTSGWRDGETAAAERDCDQFVQGPFDAGTWRARILADAPDVLLYPEIGMDRMAAVLAGVRLAPVQCNSLGHPDTSGLPTVDYFLSSAEMEPEDGERHYSERLVRLPHLGLHYSPRVIEDVAFSRAEMGVRAGVPVFWCGQSLYKYLPQYDEIYPRIARAVGECQFTFITYPFGTDVTAQFRQRLRAAFEAFGLEMERYCVVLPRLDGHRFSAAIGQVDVVLDSIGWAGFNTNLESLVHDKPIVTFSGPLMRSRHTAAVMRVMGLHDVIAESVDEYVARAAALGRDAGARAVLSGRIAAAKHLVYGARAPIEALEGFLERAVREAGER